MPQYSNEIAFGTTEPVIGNYSATYNVTFASAFPNGETTANQNLSAIKLLQRFANIIALSANLSNANSICAAVTGLDKLPPPTNT